MNTVKTKNKYVLFFSILFLFTVFQVKAQTDDCASATLLTCGASSSGSTVGSTAKTGLPSCSYSSSSGGMWYRFVGTGQTITASLCGSSYDTKLHIYQGSCGSLTCVTNNDDACGLQSRSTFVSSAGTDYYILVAGFGSNKGNFVINLTCTGGVNTTPVASGVNFTGILQNGELLTGNYTYTDADGDSESGTTFRWLRSDDAIGTGKVAISGATSNTYTLTTADIGKYISFEVNPHDGTDAGTSVESALQGPITGNIPPVASGVNFTGILQNGELLTGNYTYTDADGDSESGTTFRWLRSDDATGTGKVAISGATSNTYTLTTADIGKYISFEVTPHDGTDAGTSVESSLQGDITSSGGGCSAPTNQVSAINVSATATTFDISSFTASLEGATGYVIYINNINSFTAPNDGTEPTADLSWNDSGQQTVYFGTSTFPNITITGLITSNEYFIKIYAYNNCSGTETYETIGASPDLDQDGDNFDIRIDCDDTNASIGNCFMTTWKTDNGGTSGSTEILIPLEASTNYNFTVDWGDGNSNTYSGLGSSLNPLHDYGIVGTYTVKITGNFPHINFDKAGDRAKILSIEQWGDIAWTSMENAFYGCTNLTYNASDIPNLTSVTNMHSMFREAIVFNGDLSAWDVSNITVMSNMFDNAIIFNQNISSWNVSNVISMEGMFAQADAFNQDISSWDMKNVVITSGMFLNADAFNQDLSNWELNSIKSLRFMFQGAIVFNNGGNPLTWTINNTVGENINMTNMFYNADAFNQDISSWNVSEVSNMEGMFGNTLIFNNGGNPLAWTVGTGTSKVTNMEDMFMEAVAFNQDISSWDVSEVSNMENMFREATTFNQDISSWDVSEVSNMEGMFEKAEVFNQDISSWNVSKVTNMNSMFNRATAFNNGDNANNANKPLTWTIGTGTANVTNMEEMFERAEAFNQDISSWNVSKVTNMRYMFNRAELFSNAGFALNWTINTTSGANVNMSNMFNSAEVFNQDISSWDVSEVINMSDMFNGAWEFNQDLGSWDISKVSDMSNMFDYSGMSIANYDATLIGWADDNGGTETIPTGITLGVQSVLYCNITNGRDILTNATNNWTINGDGRGCFETTQSGNWSDGSTWLGGSAPSGLYELVTINHNVTLDTDIDLFYQVAIIDITVGTLDLNGHNIELWDNSNIIGESNVDDLTATDDYNPGGYIEATNRGLGGNIAGLGLSLTGTSANVSLIRRYHYNANGTADPINYYISGTCNCTLNINANASSGALYQWNGTDWQPSSNIINGNIGSWTSSSAALPISLLNFEAKRQNEKVLLNWTTASEKNNAGFEIEQSSDAINFKQIALVEGAGNSTGIINYQFLVINPQSAYYRLKQIDFDGTFSYSPIRFVEKTELQNEPIMYPNPTSGKIHIGNIDNTQNIEVKVFNSLGKVLARFEGKSLDIEKEISQKLKGLKQGIYMIRLKISDKIYNKKIIRN